MSASSDEFLLNIGQCSEHAEKEHCRDDTCTSLGSPSDVHHPQLSELGLNSLSFASEFLRISRECRDLALTLD
jgi:hypothetical protein